tara:strand:+ start:117 stop:4031 length:3915 start_codon:yes stop_codon:yes gene_type:complete
MTALRVNESSGSVGSIQVADGFGGFLSGSLTAGSNITIQDNGSGSFTVAATGGAGSLTVNSGSVNVTSVTTLAASNGIVVVDEGSGRAALSASIGIAEDGDYTDGLFTDFNPSTPIGTAIDRFNEILSLLAPTPGPDLDDIDVNVDGTDVELSFGASNNLESLGTPYFSVGTGAGFSALDVNDTYQTATSGNNLRAAAFGGTSGLSNITGDLNEDVSADGSNFPANSFGNADQGELRLEINGTVIHSVDLTSFTGTGSPGSGTGITNATGSCFTNFSTAADGTLDNGTAFPNFKHRTGRYKVITTDQRQGWNYARVLHVYGATTVTTNYVEWLNDSNNDALSTSGNELDFTGTGTINLSGIEYFTGGNAQYRVRVANAYRNVYDTNNITFTTSNAGSLSSGVSFSISNQSKPTINTGAGEDHTKILHITGSSTVTATQMLSGSITAGVSVTHPLKSNISNSGQATAHGILVYNRSNNSTNQRETFRRENFRIISGSYNTQASLTDSGNVWDSQVHMTSSNGAHSNGLQFFNQRLYSPLNTLNSGDFSTFSNGPVQNPDYSGETGQRTFYRWFRNETGATQYDLTLNIQGSGTTIVPAATSLNSGRIRVFVKFPNNGSRETGWLDLATEFVLDSYSDNDGAHTANGALSFDNSLNALNYVTLGTVGILDDEYIGIRIEADTSWTGYVSQIDVTFGAGTGTISAIPDLDDIDCNDTGVTAALSFGATKSITDYSDVGTSAGFSAVALNGTYQVEASGNNLRRGVFDKTTIIEGDLNEDVSAVSPDYVANAFSDANSGSLVLEVNGSDLHTVNLAGAYDNVGAGEPGSGTGTTFTGNSGFFDLSVWRPAEYDNEVPYYLEIQRTGKYRVHTDDQRDGWNYARVKHVGSWGTRTTNYVEWVNDSESQNNNISSAGTGITQFGDDEIFHLSGVKYFINPTGSIRTRVSNIYKNVYSTSTSAVTLNTLTNATALSIVQSGSGLTSTKTENDGASPLQTLNTSTDSQNQLLHVTGAIQFSQSTSLSGTFTSDTGSSLLNCSGRLSFTHPIKTDHSISTQTASSLLVYSASDNSTHTIERFNGEQFRLTSGSYSTEASATNGSNTWNSTYSINDVGSYPAYANGLMVFDGILISPYNGGNAGDFRNHTEGGSFEGPNANVNYSSLSSSTREYYRYFINPTTSDLSIISITLTGDALLKSSFASLGAPRYGALGKNKNFYMQIKVPGQSEFMDCARDYAGGAGQTAGREGDGCLNGGVDGTIDSSGATNQINLDVASVKGTASVGGPDPIVLRFLADEDWTGYISQIQITWSS